ncbi:centrosomal protein cep290 isoform X2 [Episyrphus balteatus]|uniref:centrosomal protein cep290 isoform X2 n=1 Tax=Episyrphus balteatus TaxID=286459 RepID=UPI002485451B|nr:centrosomal protein cep290 isoform X2 [Episyrphus balteatus]
MDLSEIIALDTGYLNDEIKDEIFNALTGIQNIDDVPRKNLRKILSVCLVILKHKGEQVDNLQEQLETKTQADSGDDSHNERLQEENEKLKRIINKLEEEKTIFKTKNKEMNEEIIHLQKRLTETMHSAESDKDSSDPLSELDRQEELLKNINCKNKHIKRLLREIEALQISNIEQSKAIIDLEKRHQHAKIQVQDLSSQVVLFEGENKALKESVNELNAELTRLEGNITYLEDEREKSEAELKRIIEKLETKAKSWRLSIYEKEKEIKKLKSKLVVVSKVSLQEEDDKSESTSENDGERMAEESTRMMHAIEARDKIIENLESKIKTMAEEMISSTRLMNKLSSEREDERSMHVKKSRSCCKAVEESLSAMNKRCQELSELLEKSEEDNMLKSKQAVQAISALEAYQQGEDGLSNALKTIGKLEQKLDAREKHIRELVFELNSLHELSNENTLLRKKLNIPDDVVIMAKNRAAKERSKDKQIERLTLKLRSSEELRLQLKLEKSDLRKQLIQLQKSQNQTPASSPENLSPIKQRSEIYCDNCLKNIPVLPNNDLIMQDVIKEWENKYHDVVEENENLRSGMHEILEKIREYDATSDHITIDCEILERLLNTLDTHSFNGWYNPVKRIQNELVTLKEREHALREKINAAKSDHEQQSPIKSIDEIREAGEITDSPHPSLPMNPIGSSTRPTTPNITLDQSLYPVIVEADIEHESMKKEFLNILEKNRSLQHEIQRLQVFQVQFEELTSQMGASDSDITKYCSILVEKIATLEIELNSKTKTFDFLKDDFDRILNESKSSEMRNMTLIAELKKQVNDRKVDVYNLKSENDKLTRKNSICNSEDYVEMQKTLFGLQSQLASLMDQILSGNIPDIKIDEICTDYGVIQENLELDYLTVEEYEELQKKTIDILSANKDLQTKCDHLEGLLGIANEQVMSQQKLLTEITDNHINLRHLVADLQSSNEDKFLIAKIQRELDSAKKEITTLTFEKEKNEKNEEILIRDNRAKVKELQDINKGFQSQIKNNDIKRKFLQKALLNLRQKYFKFTPLIFISNFVYAYSKFTKRLRDDEVKMQNQISMQIDRILSSKIETSFGTDNDSQDMIKLVKTETKAKYFEDQVQVLNERNTALQIEIDKLCLSIVKENEHWKTIDALFGGEQSSAEVMEKEVQTDVVEFVDSNTKPEQDDQSTNKILPKVDKNTSPIASPTKQKVATEITSSESQTSPIDMINQQTSPIRTPLKKSTNVEELISESQGVQTSPFKELTKHLSTQGVQTSPLKKPETEKVYQAVQTSPKQSPIQTGEGNGKVQELEKQLKESVLLAEERKQLLENSELSLTEHQKTIEKLNNKIKDQEDKLQMQTSNSTEEKMNSQFGMIEKTIMSFQTLLSEKDKAINKYQELLTSERTENDEACAKYEKTLESFQQTINDLSANCKAKDEEILELKTKIESAAGTEKEKLEIATGIDDNGDNSLQEISDEKIEEMFNDDAVSDSSDKKVTKGVELKNKEKHWENSLRVKDEEILLLKEKLQLSKEKEKEKNDWVANPEIDQLRILLEEKDKHINDLMDTLSNFHDDQQRYFNDSSTYSADQISQLAASLTRSEATNKIYKAQLEALRRQLANLNQREKQARDLNNSLRNQLIKRPVVSIKTELNARLKTENLQKKVCQLENELEEAQVQIKRQQVVIDAKRAKSNNEVGLWEKQKRWQQSAEKYKTKFEETEAALEKQKALLHSARTTIARLEKDKQVLEARVGKAPNALKCCRTPSCPNLHQGTKYTPSETPETYTGGSECSSPARGMHFLGSNHNELIEALKARIEMQQRKIIAMEMEGKGSNALTTELEKVQEKYSAIEAQNIRLEARNLQLQLDNDLLRQGDSGERMQKRVKHLEDYIIALKEELAQAEARRELNFEPKNDRKYAPGQAEQTILSLRSIIEKLRAENRYLKDGTRSFDARSKEAPTELTRLQTMYTESLDKISALQIELQLKARCQNCGNKSLLETSTNDDVRLIKEQLVKKTQLLEKAKILLTRAAAKEKILKEQLSSWKRKCSELQNVPVIDEISE